MHFLMGELTLLVEVHKEVTQAIQCLDQFVLEYFVAIIQQIYVDDSQVHHFDMQESVYLIDVARRITEDVVQQFFVYLSANGESDLLHFWEGLHLREEEDDRLHDLDGELLDQGDAVGLEQGEGFEEIDVDVRPTDKTFEDLHDLYDGTLPEVQVYAVASVYGLEQIVQKGKVELEEFVNNVGVGDFEAFVVHNCF